MARAGRWVWSWLSWWSQTRQLKAAGFRRTGWTRWEAGPAQTPERTAERSAGELFFRGPVDDQWKPLGSAPLDFEFQPIPSPLARDLARLPFGTRTGKLEVTMPLVGREPDWLREIRTAMILRLPFGESAHRELHCARDVAAAMHDVSPRPPSYDPPAGIAVAILFGVDIVVEGDMTPGQWELREAGTVVDSGCLEGV